MTQRQMAKVLHERFPLMDVSFLNKCLHPDRSGGQLTDEAYAVLGKAKIARIRRERPGTRKYTFRAESAQIGALQRAKKYMGVHTDQLIISKAIDTALDAWGIYAGGKR